MSDHPGKTQPHPNSAHIALTVACLLLGFTDLSTASTLEQVYQKALEDPEFKIADGELNAAYSLGMRTLPKEERDKLRQAERFWIRENQELMQQTPDGAVDLLKKRFLKRRDELLQLNLSPEHSAPAPTREPAPAPTTSPAPSAPLAATPTTAQPTQAHPTPPAGWNEKVAANLERVYQRALLDPAFAAADSSLRTTFKETISALPTADREKLKPAQKAWVRENAVLVAADSAKEQSLLLSRVLERKAQLERMREERRFEPSSVLAQPAPRPVSLPPPQLPPPVLKEPSLPPPTLAETPPTLTPSTPPQPSTPAAELSSAKPEKDRHQFFWALLGTWILGAGFFHYRAFARTPTKPESNPQPLLNIRGLYLATGTGCLVSLIPLFAVPSAFTAVVAVLFTIAGLGTAKVAAEEWARTPTKPAPNQARKLAPTPEEMAFLPASVPAQPSAVPVHAELQRPQTVQRRKGNRQKRRNR